MVAPSNKVIGREMSSRPAKFAQGGNTKMFGKQFADPQVPFHTAHDTKGGPGTFAQGGKTKMFGKQEANPASPGISSHGDGSSKGNDTGSGGGRVTKAMKAAYGG